MTDVDALVTADQVVYAIAWLAAPAATSPTGTLLRVDGGSTALRP